MHVIATARSPALTACPVVKLWAGRCPDIEGLYINTGQCRNGVVLTTASARLMADRMLSREPIVDPSPCTWTAAHV